MVITGLGAVTPLGNDVPSSWEALTAGSGGAGPITAFDASGYPARFACELKEFEPDQWLDRKQVRRLDRFAQMIGAHRPGLDMAKLLPKVVVAGADAGSLTAEGAALLDPSGSIKAGVPVCPPEGDAGTGMVASGLAGSSSSSNRTVTVASSTGVAS